ncbi:MAG TPA: hypothetical protein VIL65_02475 [Beijerinckiaceae bacterium]|jgi:hypothetical protein
MLKAWSGGLAALILTGSSVAAQMASSIPREERARELAIEYLEFWSAPNGLALDTVPEFYASRVVFHGREVSARELTEEKRRFVRRWPERDYRHRRDSIDVRCEANGDLCTVRSVFDYDARNPSTGRASSGVAAFALDVAFDGPRPVIVGETSRVLRRTDPDADATSSLR